MSQSSERAHDVELRRPVHGAIHLRVAGQLRERALRPAPGTARRGRGGARRTPRRRPSYSGSSQVPAASCRSSTSMTSAGRAARWRAVSATQSGMLAGELAIVAETTPRGWRTRYSMSSMPPQLWPRMWTAVQAQRLAHGIDLAHVEVDGPARRIVRLVGVAAALLVVEDHPPAGRRDVPRSTRGSRGTRPGHHGAAAAALAGRLARRPRSPTTATQVRPPSKVTNRSSAPSAGSMVTRSLRASCPSLPIDARGSAGAARGSG